MRTRKVATLLLLLIFQAPAWGQTPVELLQRFYRAYLGYVQGEATSGTSPELRFSRAFEKLRARNAKICASHASGVCGFGADGDIYLDTQESDPDLSYDNSGIVFRNLGNNRVEVTLNVYPSEKTKPDFYQRRIDYRLVWEEGAWVVDDILYGGKRSARQGMREEIVQYLAHPDPDSKIMIRRR